MSCSSARFFVRLTVWAIKHTLTVFEHFDGHAIAVFQKWRTEDARIDFFQHPFFGQAGRTL